MARVEIYTTSMCPFCVQAKRLLKELGIAYDEHDVENDAERRTEMLRRAEGRRTVPQIFIDGEAIGGYVELRALHDHGKLAQLH